MIGSTCAPNRWQEVEVSKVQSATMGATGTATANTTTNIDVLISDDCLISSIELIASNATFGDTVTVKIIDKDGVYAPPNTVLATPVTNFNIIGDTQLQARYDAIAPFKILGGVYFRFAYTSTSLLTNVSVAANLILAKLLI